MMPPELHRRLLEQYSAPSVIVDDDYTVLHVSDRAGRYLQIAGGELSPNLLQLVRPDLQADLRAALLQSGHERRVVDVRSVPVTLDDGPHTVDISVRPALQEGEPARGLYLVVFHERPDHDPASVAPIAPTDHEFLNFIHSTDIATIFLDREFRVKLFTVQAQEVFNLREGDIGRDLSDIPSHVVDDGIHEDVRRVLDTLQTIEREVRTRSGRFHLMRVRPYRTVDNRIDGIVLTFLDITARREAELRGRIADERLRLLIESAVDYAMFTTSEDGRIESWNAGAERLFRYTADEIIGRLIDVLFTPEDRKAKVPQRELDRARRTGRAADERYHLRKDGTRFYVSGTTTPLGEPGMGFAKVARDLTIHQEAEAALRRAFGELELRVRVRTRELEAEKTVVTDLARRIVSAQEDERGRIARDLHDSMGQQMTALRLTLERHGQRCPIASGDGGITDALALTATVGEQIDFLARELRPAAVELLGLASALPRFVEAWGAHVGIATEFRLQDFRAGSLSPDVETTFYRIAQEALNNAAKHAHPSRIDVVLSARDGQAILIIEDDGIGFDTLGSDLKTRGMGLMTMRERAALVGATFDIESEPGRGTSIYVRVPLGMG